MKWIFRIKNTKTAYAKRREYGTPEADRKWGAKGTSGYDKDRTCERAKLICRKEVEDGAQGADEDDVRKKDKDDMRKTKTAFAKYKVDVPKRGGRWHP